MTAADFANFALGIAAMLGAALVSKMGAVLLGVRMAGQRLDRSAWAMAFGLNARGATGIIPAGIGLANAVIDERLFVAVALMCLVTTLVAAPAMQGLLRNVGNGVQGTENREPA